ncbi:MAG: hypothetical protein AB1427_14110 [Thermodesulfobacteriota bacterium]
METHLNQYPNPESGAQAAPSSHRFFKRMIVIDIASVMRIVIYFISLFQEDIARDDDMTMIFRKLYFFLYLRIDLDGVDGSDGDFRITGMALKHPNGIPERLVKLSHSE